MTEGRKWRVCHLEFEGDEGNKGAVFNEDGTDVYCSLLIEREDRRVLTPDDCDFVFRIIGRVAGWLGYALDHGGRVTGPRLSGKMKAEVMARDGNRCAACGGTPPATRLDVHHYITSRGCMFRTT